MENVERASDLPTGAVVQSGHSNSAFSSDLLGVINGQSGAVESDFFVDYLLDFSSAFLSEDPEEQKQENASDKDGCATARTTAKSSVVLTPKDEFPVSGLSVPADDLESLEWLSHFVKDLFSQYSLPCPIAKLPPEASKSRSDPKIVVVEVKPSIPTWVKPRLKPSGPGLAGSLKKLSFYVLVGLKMMGILMLGHLIYQ